jgi:hypothetical protein
MAFDPIMAKTQKKLGALVLGGGGNIGSQND